MYRCESYRHLIREAADWPGLGLVFIHDEAVTDTPQRLQELSLFEASHEASRVFSLNITDDVYARTSLGIQRCPVYFLMFNKNIIGYDRGDDIACKFNDLSAFVAKVLRVRAADLPY